MILQNLSNIETIDYLIICCYSAVIAAFMISGIILVIRLKDKQKQIRNYLLGIALFFILYGIARIIMFLFELTFDPFVWRIDVNEFDKIFAEHPEIDARHEIVWRASTGIGTLGVVILMYQLELRILEKRTKFIFTILQIVSVIPALILGVEGKDEITVVRIILYAGNVLLLFIPLFYLYYAFKTTGETRKRAIGATMGIFILFFGVLFNSSIGKTLFNTTFGIQGLYITYYLFAICVVIGIVIYMKSIKY